MVKLEIIKPCWNSCYLFEFFILNNKAVFCDAFLSQDWKKKSLFSNTFFSFVFHSTMKVHTAGKDPMKYFAQN